MILSCVPLVQPTYFRGDAFQGFYNATGPTFMGWVPRMTELLHCASGMREYYTTEAEKRCRSASPLERSVLSLDCMHEACVLVKR